MKRNKFIFISIFLLFLSQICVAQTNKIKPPSTNDKPGSQTAKSSAAYAEVLLRKTELTAELESLLSSYTEEYPKLKEIRVESEFLQIGLTRLLAINASESAKLTSALGKLLVRKAELETDHWRLQKQYSGEHPEVKRARRKVEIFEQAVNEILK